MRKLYELGLISAGFLSVTGTAVAQDMELVMSSWLPRGTPSSSTR